MCKNLQKSDIRKFSRTWIAMQNLSCILVEYYLITVAVKFSELTQNKIFYLRTLFLLTAKT